MDYLDYARKKLNAAIDKQVLESYGIYIDKEKSMQLRLVQTCEACPEQYDVFLEDKEIGYLRLRHGFFRAEFEGEVVYSSYPDGDGMFQDNEREKYLTEACDMIIKEYIKKYVKGKKRDQTISLNIQS